MKWLLLGLLYPAVSSGQVYGFKSLDASKFKVDEKSQIEITNLPPLQSQDTLGICYGVAASVILTAENCRSMNTDCKTITSDKVFSPLGLSPIGRPAEDKAPAKKSKNENPDPYGGSIYNTLDQLVLSGEFAPSEQCLSLEKILSRVGGSAEASEVQLGIWKKLKALYEKSKEVPKDCESCLNSFYSTAQKEIQEGLDVDVSNESMLKAFGKKTYAEFFDRILISPECRKLSKSVAVEYPSKKDFKFYPLLGKTGTYNEAINTIKNVLNDGRPLGLGNICLDEKPSSKKCENQHGVVVAGYRKTCDSKGKCVDSVKVLNSWGKSWQDQNADGWVDAKTLLDRTFYKEATLTWIADKK
ncbi:hypothetical protein [Bdellovibrio sp. HCB209]|uniref:hypothetical protein n=1 Tax=Bdellovibrio sp. HCB209 TaxID=3394354 RepID=UPI0039B3BACF